MGKKNELLLSWVAPIINQPLKMAEEKCPSGADHRGYSTEQPFCLYYSVYYRHQKIEIKL